MIKPNLLFNSSILKPRTTKKVVNKKIKFNKINITDASLILTDRNFIIKSINLNVRTTIKENITYLKVYSNHLNIKFKLLNKWFELSGAFKSILKLQGNYIKIMNFVWETENLIININGNLENKYYYMNIYTQGDLNKFLQPLLSDFSPHGNAYSHIRLIKDKNNIIKINTNIHVNTAKINDVVFDNLKTIIKWNSESKSAIIKTTYRNHINKKAALITAINKNNKFSINVFNLEAAKIIKLINITNEIPLKNLIKSGKIEIIKDNLKADLNMIKNPKVPEPFNLNGKLIINHNFKKEISRVYAKNIFNNSESASVKIFFNEKGSILNIDLNAKINDTKNINVYSTYYGDIDLNFLKLSKGKGNIKLRFSKIREKPELNINFDINNVLSNKQAIKNIRGRIVSISDKPSANFFINDKKINGEITLNKEYKKLIFKFKNIKAELNKTLKILDLNLNIYGNSIGNLTLEKDLKTNQFTLTGQIKSKKIKAFDYELKDYKSQLQSNLKNISLKNINFIYKKGIGNANIFLDFYKHKFDINGNVKGFDINAMNKNFNGKGDMNFNGKGEFFKDPVIINLELNRANYYEDRYFNIKSETLAYTNFSNYNTKTKGYIESKSKKSQFTININKKDDLYSGDFKIDIIDMDMLMPWENNKGKIEISGNIYSKQPESMNFKGIARFSGEQLVIPSFPHTIKNFEGYLIFNDLVFNLRTLTGKLGNGDIVSKGIIKIKDSKLSELNINFTGSNMKLYPMDRFTCTLNSSINIKLTKRNRILLKGDLIFSSVIWSREINEPIEFNTNSSITPSESKLLRMIDFNLNLRGKKNIKMINSFGKAQGRFNLKLLGSHSFPVLLGVIEADKGEIYFSDNAFKILKAKVFFNNRQFINPIIDIDAEAFIKNYRIRFRINGTAYHPKPQFSSTPPLPPQDILALLSLGELYNRASSTEIRSQIGTTSLLSSQLIEQIKSRAKKLFGIDILKFDPYIKGTSLEQNVSRITIGKAISKDLIVVYSTNISTLQKDIIYLQYNLSPMISIIGMRNEDGRFSIDIRFRKRNK